MDHVARYLPTIKALAERALDMAVDASPTKPREGEFVRSLMVGLPVARVLVQQDYEIEPAVKSLLEAAAALHGNDNQAHQPVRYTDGVGHSRPIYPRLLLAMAIRCMQPGDSRADLVLRLASPYIPESDDILGGCEHPRIGVFGELCRSRHFCLWEGESYRLDGYVDWALSDSQTQGSIQRASVDAAPDEWVFDELVLLHAAFELAFLHRRDDWLERARVAALYHLHHTQPDYTTYQPWALAAFLWFPETVPFAEQQLHDVQTHLAVEGPPGALVPGLLLADAYATLRELLEQETA